MNIGYEAKRIFHNKTGLGNYSRDLVRILASNYPKENFFLYNPKHSEKNLFNVNNKNIFERNPNTYWSKKFSSFWRQKSVVKDLVKNEIEIFHGLSGEIPIGLKKAKIKSVVTIHDLIFMKFPYLYSFFDRKIHYLKFKKSAHNADVIISISEQTKNDIITYLGINPEKIKVIYQGCQKDFKQTYTEDEKNDITKKYDLPQTYILNVGTIEERKNAFTIVKAIKNIDTKLILIGKQTSYSKKIHQYIKDNSLENKVIFLQELTSKELAIIYQLATIFVYPSFYEGFGIPIIEALYSRTPVITTNSSVFTEAAGPDSIYINPNNVKELELKILNLLENTNLRLTIAEKGFLYAQKFNDEVIAKQIMKCYTDLF